MTFRPAYPLRRGRSHPGPNTLSFPKAEALHPADFTIPENEVVRLNPELAPKSSDCSRLFGETLRASLLDGDFHPDLAT
jgi:hypothetical protein